MDNKEIWKDIANYEGLYQISNLGRVKSLNYRKTKKSKVMKTKIDRNGYETISLCKKNKIKTFLVNQLVAKAFIPNPNNYKETNHKDEDKLNNCVENLEWCTRSYNINYGKRNEKCSMKLKQIKFKIKKVYQYDLQGNLIKVWDSVTNISNYYKISKSHISNVCRKNKNFFKEYYWSYSKEDKENIILKYNFFKNKNNIINLCNEKYERIYNKKTNKSEYLRYLRLTNKVITLLNKIA